MGVFEEILKSNQTILKQFEGIEFIKNEFFKLQEQIDSLEKTLIEKRKDEDALSLKFNDDEKLNITLASKILNITHAEVLTFVKQGKLNSLGTRKHLFSVSELRSFKEYLKGRTSRKAIINNIKIQ